MSSEETSGETSGATHMHTHIYTVHLIINPPPVAPGWWLVSATPGWLLSVPRQLPAAPESLFAAPGQLSAALGWWQGTALGCP